MAIIDSYRNNANRKKQEILKFNQDIAKEQKKIADYSKKNISANQSIKRTTSQSTINSKMREIERNDKCISDSKIKIANLQSKIAQKQKELNNEEIKISKEEDKISKKKIQEDTKRQNEVNRRDHAISNQLSYHQSLHQRTLTEIDKLKQPAPKINVLFFAANPLDQNQLRLDEEVRSIMENIRKSEFRESVNFNSVWATRPLDILQSLNEYKPTIIHFSGHGSDSEELVFQDGEGNTKLVSKEAIVQMMSATSDGIRVVFFNTCYSKKQAQAIIQHVEAAIGMNNTIGDTAARIFAAQFYSAIGFGKSIIKAFEQAKAALMLENIPEENTPELFINENIVGENIVLVSKK